MYGTAVTGALKDYTGCAFPHCTDSTLENTVVESNANFESTQLDIK